MYNVAITLDSLVLGARRTYDEIALVDAVEVQLVLAVEWGGAACEAVEVGDEGEGVALE